MNTSATANEKKKSWYKVVPLTVNDLQIIIIYYVCKRIFRRNIKYSASTYWASKFISVRILKAFIPKFLK